MTAPTPPSGIAMFVTDIKVMDWLNLVRWYVEILELRLGRDDPAYRYALLEEGPGRLAL